MQEQRVVHPSMHPDEPVVWFDLTSGMFTFALASDLVIARESDFTPEERMQVAGYPVGDQTISRAELIRIVADRGIDADAEAAR